MAIFKTNQGGREVTVDVSFEDEHVGILVTDTESGKELLDVITQDKKEIEALVRDVAQASADAGL